MLSFGDHSNSIVRYCEFVVVFGFLVVFWWLIEFEFLISASNVKLGIIRIILFILKVNFRFSLNIYPFGIEISMNFLNELYLFQSFQYPNHRPLVNDSLINFQIFFHLDDMSPEIKRALWSFYLKVVQDIDIPIEFQRRTLSFRLLDADWWYVVGELCVYNMLKKLLVCQLLWWHGGKVFVEVLATDLC